MKKEDSFFIQMTLRVMEHDDSYNDLQGKQITGALANMITTVKPQELEPHYLDMMVRQLVRQVKVNLSDES